jgi:hypothetical protein
MRAWANVKVWKPPWLGVFATTALPDQFGVDLHAHGVVPTGDIGHRARQGLSLLSVTRGELPLDLADIPADAVHTAVDIGAGQAPGFADLPDQKQRQQFAVLDQGVHRLGHLRPAFVEIDVGP